MSNININNDVKINTTNIELHLCLYPCLWMRCNHFLISVFRTESKLFLENPFLYFLSTKMMALRSKVKRPLSTSSWTMKEKASSSSSFLFKQPGEKNLTDRTDLGKKRRP